MTNAPTGKYAKTIPASMRVRVIRALRKTKLVPPRRDIRIFVTGALTTKDARAERYATFLQRHALKLLVRRDIQRRLLRAVRAIR